MKSDERRNARSNFFRRPFSHPQKNERSTVTSSERKVVCDATLLDHANLLAKVFSFLRDKDF